jgi:hypothetical protein
MEFLDYRLTMFKSKPMHLIKHCGNGGIIFLKSCLILELTFILTDAVLAEKVGDAIAAREVSFMFQVARHSS